MATFKVEVIKRGIIVVDVFISLEEAEARCKELNEQL